MNCNSCLRKYNSAIPTLIPRMLRKCGHTMCQYCIGRQMINGTIVCPFDRKVTVVGNSVDLLPKNFAILEIMEKVSIGENSQEGGVDNEDGASSCFDQDSVEGITDEEVPEEDTGVSNRIPAHEALTAGLEESHHNLVPNVPNENPEAETPTVRNQVPALPKETPAFSEEVPALPEEARRVSNQEIAMSLPVETLHMPEEVPALPEEVPEASTDAAPASTAGVHQSIRNQVPTLPEEEVPAASPDTARADAVGVNRAVRNQTELDSHLQPVYPRGQTVRRPTVRRPSDVDAELLEIAITLSILDMNKTNQINN